MLFSWRLGVRVTPIYDISSLVFDWTVLARSLMLPRRSTLLSRVIRLTIAESPFLSNYFSSVRYLAIVSLRDRLRFKSFARSDSCSNLSSTFWLSWLLEELFAETATLSDLLSFKFGATMIVPDRTRDRLRSLTVCLTLVNRSAAVSLTFSSSSANARNPMADDQGLLASAFASSVCRLRADNTLIFI